MTITSYTALRLVEIEKGGEKDSEMIILFDETEQSYYIYGTRRPLKSAKNEQLDYEFVYDYSRLNSLVSFIMMTTNKLYKAAADDNKYTIELHHIQICDCELDRLDYKYLFSKFSKHNEIVAYDEQGLFKKQLRKLLKTLTSSY
jgi:hypothetical protein